MLTRVIAALALTAACLPPQEPATPTKPGGAKTVVDPNDPDSGFNRAQWNQAVGLGLQAGKYGGRRLSAQGLTHLQSMRHQDGGWRATAAAEVSDPTLTLWGTCLLGTAADAGLVALNESAAKIADWLSGPRANMAPDSGVLAKAPPATRQAELAFDQRVANAFASYWIAKACGQEQRTLLIAMRTDALEHARTLPRTWSEAPGQKLSMHEWFCSSHLLVQNGEVEAVAKMTKTLAAAQVRDGEHAGSWPPIGAWGDVGGRVWTTAMAVLTMESPYRYTRFEPAMPPEGQGR